MMLALKTTLRVFAVTTPLSVVLTAEPAQARCRTFQASHNGTDMFYATGTVGTAKHKLMWQVEEWRKKRGIKRVRFGKIRTRCGKWFIKYMLPHKHCVAKARVCY